MRLFDFLKPKKEENDKIKEIVRNSDFYDEGHKNIIAALLDSPETGKLMISTALFFIINESASKSIEEELSKEDLIKLRGFKTEWNKLISEYSENEYIGVLGYKYDKNPYILIQIRDLKIKKAVNDFPTIMELMKNEDDHLKEVGEFFDKSITKKEKDKMFGKAKEKLEKGEYEKTDNGIKIRID